MSFTPHHLRSTFAMEPIYDPIINDVNFASTEPEIESQDGLPTPFYTDLENVLNPENLFDEEEMFRGLPNIELDFPADFQMLVDNQTIDGEMANRQITPPPSSSPANLDDVDAVASQTPMRTVICTDKYEKSGMTDAHEFVLFSQNLTLLIKPKAKQRARRINDLLKFLRYIRVEEKNEIVIGMPDIRPHLYEKMTVALRITRLIVTLGDNQNRMVHPYPLWIKDQTAKTHHSSLLINVSDEMMQQGQIKIAKLVIVQPLQTELAATMPFLVYNPEKFDWEERVSTKLKSAKAMIEQFRLNYSILHFQIILIDKNQRAYPTDLICETEPVHFFDPKERKPASSPSSSSQTRTLKRVGNSSKKKYPKKTFEETTQLERHVC